MTLTSRTSPYSPLYLILFGLGGLAASILGAWLVIAILLQPPMGEIIYLFSALAASAIISLAIGFVATYYTARVSPSLLLTLVIAYLWTSFLIIINVWNGARLMFFNLDHDLPLAISLLVFASILAAAFGLAVTMRVVGDLRELSNSASMIAQGNLSVRVTPRGRDEVSQVARSFNEMARQLQDAESVRAELMQLRKDLIAWTSHDLRTPLTSMRAMVEAMKDGLVDDPEMKNRYFHTILNDISALNTLMDDLFEYSQLESGGLKINRRSQSMGELVSNVVDKFHGVTTQQEITLWSEIDPDVDSVMMDVDLIDRVISNLVSNACRHTPAGGSIGIRTAHIKEGNREALSVSVVDSGSGFQEKDINHVFEQFYRGEEARTRAKGGGGLGLAIAKSVIELHGGEIWAENRAEGGAVVTFTLPI